MRKDYRSWKYQEHELAKLAGEGLLVEVIAERLGRTVGAVYVRACVLGVKLRRRSRSVPPVHVKSVCPDIRPAIFEALEAAPHIQALRHPYCSEQSWLHQITAYVANVSLSAEHAAIGRTIGWSPKMVRYAVGRIEDRRDDPGLDAFLDHVGEALAA